MSGGTTRYDEIVPHDEIFRVKREWIELSGGKPMPFFARYTAWGVWALGVVLSLVAEYALGLMNLGILSALIVLASLIFESMAVMAVFLFGVDFDRPMLAVLAQLWRGIRLRLAGLMPSQAPRSTVFVLRATARQQRPARRPWRARLSSALGAEMTDSWRRLPDYRFGPPRFTPKTNGQALIFVCAAVLGIVAVLVLVPSLFVILRSA